MICGAIVNGMMSYSTEEIGDSNMKEFLKEYIKQLIQVIIIVLGIFVGILLSYLPIYYNNILLFIPFILYATLILTLIKYY